ncbi:hypothetical protein [Methanobrevibacter sp.]|uniref:hypothetical protein n=1 Tax=Methanobrevibacter sp. TaxID=66852 RepID=UPI00388EAC62
MTNKICNNCGSIVNSSLNHCPKCRSASFRNVYEITKQNNSLVNRLFYDYQDSYFILSKSKVAAVITFLLFLTLGPTNLGIILLSLISAAIVYVVGNSIHNMLGKEQKPRLVVENSSQGLLTDLKHLFFYWQDKSTGIYTFSKTKALSVLMFLFFASFGAIFSLSSVFYMGLFGLSVAVPAFFIGYGIHKLTTSDPIGELLGKTKSVGTRDVKVKSNANEFDQYRTRLNELKAMYDIKESNARKLIEERFAPPQLTYDRFIANVDNSTKMFKENEDAILNLIELGSTDNSEISKEIASRMSILESLVDKMDGLIDELILSMSKEDKKEKNPTGFMHSMDHLIDSVKEYKH